MSIIPSSTAHSHAEVVHYQVDHFTRYHYGLPSWDAFGVLHLHPVNTRYQSISDFRIHVEPQCHFHEYRDVFDNNTHDYHLLQQHPQLTFNSRFNAEVSSQPRWKSEDHAVTYGDIWEIRNSQRSFYDFSAPTPKVQSKDLDWLERLDFHKPVLNTPLLDYLLELNTHLHQYFTYQPGSTDVQTTALEAINLKSGVCQDYTHVLLATLRSIGIPARYISGYLYIGQGSHWVGDAASHAWVEAFVPGVGWVGFDPTNGVATDQNHIVLAVGRDYDDISPVTCLYRGGGFTWLEVKVSVVRV
jgi:transglutaminase-like putative cysteine protease